MHKVSGCPAFGAQTIQVARGQEKTKQTEPRQASVAFMGSRGQGATKTGTEEKRNKTKVENVD